MSQTSVSFSKGMGNPLPSVIVEEDTQAADASNEDILVELDFQLEEKVRQLKVLVEHWSATLKASLKPVQHELKPVLKMTMRDFCIKHSGDIHEAMKAMMEPPPPAPMPVVPRNGGAAPGAGAGPSVPARAPVKQPLAPAAGNATGRKRAAAPEPAGGETPSLRGRSTRSKLGTAATPADRKAGVTPNDRSMFTPKVGATPRLPQPQENTYSSNGSPINHAVGTVRAAGGHKQLGRMPPAPSVVITMEDGKEVDLADKDSLLDLQADDHAKAWAVSEVERLRSQMEEYLKALKANERLEM